MAGLRYQRFTDRARKVMRLASEEVQSLGHQYTGTLHILLGLAKEGDGVAAFVLKSLGIDYDRIRREVEKIPHLDVGPAADGKLLLTDHANEVIDYSHEEARRLEHMYVGTEHLLLALVHTETFAADSNQDSAVVRLLREAGVKSEDIRKQVLNILGHDFTKE